MDNFSVHNATVEQMKNKLHTALKNTTVIFLPPNVTSRHQPLDQGIIHAWKCHYLNKWLTYLIARADLGKDTMEEMEVLKAMRWGMTSWHLKVTETTIENCWIKSGLLGIIP